MATYACADIHGSYPAFAALREKLSATDTCYILGDLADRGPEGWRIIEEAVADPRFIILMGNHEDMLLRAAESYLSCPREERDFFFASDFDYQCLRRNGGAKTFADWTTSQFPAQWARKIAQFPIVATYINTSGKTIILSHSGFTPCNPPIDKLDYLWNRDHFTEEWVGHENEIIVHGHTPVLYMELPGGYPSVVEPLFYANNHKINIDTGVCFTGVFSLLNLDTLTAETIEVEPVIG